MKRKGNLYDKIISVDNLYLADKIARRGKRNYSDIKLFDKDKEENILKLHEKLKRKKYRTSEYKIFTIFDPKERIIFQLPYYPDRIVHHAIMNILESVFVNCFIKTTYSCIKKRGIHKALKDVREALRDKENTIYCLKLDIKKFYPSINHEILKTFLRKKIKDKDLLCLLDEIIDSAPGVPIGNYLSQYFANFYLTYFDHWLKEVKKCKYYFRYSDDLVILHGTKDYLHKLLKEIKIYLKEELKLEVKENYQIFPIESRGLDFVGYRIYHSYCFIRDKIKRNFIRKLKRKINENSIAAYYGWLKHCDSKHLIKKYLINYN